MTVDRFVSDLRELVDHVCMRLGRKQVTVLGHSWGSSLGVLYASRFPEKVAAYVGCAQIGDAAEGERASYAYAVAQAERLGDRRTLEKLRALGPPPHTARQLMKERTWVQRLDRQLGPRMLWTMARVALAEEEASLSELPDALRGFRFSLDTLWDEASNLNLLELAPELRMPVFFFLGRKDHWVPPETSLAYYEALRAPSKQLVWFENSGHEPFVDEPEKFNAEMLERVLPAVSRPPAPGEGPRGEALGPGDAHPVG
jgi:pimeloyl-ACP methyl ester carboxylesterase